MMYTQLTNESLAPRPGAALKCNFIPRQSHLPFLAALRICLWANPQLLPSSPHICQPHLIYDNASSSSFHLCFSWRSAKEHLSTIRRRHPPLPSMRSTQGQWMGMSFSSRPTPAGGGLMVCTAMRCFPIGGANKLMNARQPPPRTSIRSWSDFIITLATQWSGNDWENYYSIPKWTSFHRHGRSFPIEVFMDIWSGINANIFPLFPLRTGVSVVAYQSIAPGYFINFSTQEQSTSLQVFLKRNTIKRHIQGKEQGEDRISRGRLIWFSFFRLPPPLLLLYLIHTWQQICT